VVTSGYNNVSPGDGKGYLYVLDLASGAILSTIATNAGDTATPTGLAKIAAYADLFQKDNTSRYVYGGDIRGNVWRFDLDTDTVLLMGTLTDSASRPQSVTTRPELSSIKGYRVLFIGTGRFLGMSDLQDPATWIPASTDAYQQSLYAFKDTGVPLGNLRTSGNLVKQTLSVSSLTRSTSTNSVDWTSANGWYVDFNPGGDSPGERVNIDPQLVMGTLVVGTNVPNMTACTFGGDSLIYYFRYDSGTYVATSPSQIVAQKFPGKLMAGITLYGIGGNASGNIKFADNSNSTTHPPVGGSAGTGKRIGWREISQ
jgi:type IV pilus assembly protein PilY1